ncbi:hypothetical protein ABZ651_34460, partial [Streptomyces sp. NPDC007070]
MKPSKTQRVRVGRGVPESSGGRRSLSTPAPLPFRRSGPPSGPGPGRAGRRPRGFPSPTSRNDAVTGAVRFGRRRRGTGVSCGRPRALRDDGTRLDGHGQGSERRGCVDQRVAGRTTRDTPGRGASGTGTPGAGTGTPGANPARAADPGPQTDGPPPAAGSPGPTDRPTTPATPETTGRRAPRDAPRTEGPLRGTSETADRSVFRDTSGTDGPSPAGGTSGTPDRSASRGASATGGPPSPDARRRIPRTDALLRDPRLAGAAVRLGSDAVKAAVRQAQERARHGAVAPEQVADTAVALLPPT